MNRIGRESGISNGWLLILLAMASLAVLFFIPFVGTIMIRFSDIFAQSGESVNSSVFWQMRIPRVCVGFMAGGLFALCGMVFQALFRNPLVAPSTLGVSAGASLGAAIYIIGGISFSFLGVTGITFFSFLGAILAIYIVWSFTKGESSISVSRMLLSGIAVSFIFVSLIMFFQYFSDITQSFQITRWLMGGIFVYGYDSVWHLLIFTVLGLFSIIYFSNELNLFVTGNDTAISRGVDVDRVIKILFFLVSVIIAGVVSICGPITFVGIIAPHICRLMVGSDHRYLTGATFMFGGILLVLCDALARILIAPAEIPVGVITALLGGPFFLWLLRKRYVE